MSSHTKNLSAMIYLSAQDGENFSTSEASCRSSNSGESLVLQQLFGCVWRWYGAKRVSAALPTRRIATAKVRRGGTIVPPCCNMRHG